MNFGPIEIGLLALAAVILALAALWIREEFIRWLGWRRSRRQAGSRYSRRD